MPEVDLQALDRDISPLIMDDHGGSPMLVDDLPDEINGPVNCEHHPPEPAVPPMSTGNESDENEVEYHPIVNGTFHHPIFENHPDRSLR